MKRIKTVLKIALMLGLLGYLVKNGELDFTALARDGWTPRIVLLHGLGLAVLLVSMLLQVRRWMLVLATQRCSLPLGTIMRVFWVAGAYSLILPGTLGMDALRGASLYRAVDKGRFAAVSTVVTDRAVGLFTLLWLAGLASAVILAYRGFDLSLPLAWESLAGTGVFVGLTAALAVFFLTPGEALLRWLGPLRRFERTFSTLAQHVEDKRGMAGYLRVSLLSTFFDTLSYYIAALALGLSPDFLLTFLLGPVVTIANLLPLSPGGIGVAEATAAVLFRMDGIALGAMIMMLTRVWMFLLRLPGIFLLGAGRSA